MQKGAHLSGAGLGKVSDENDTLRRREGTDRLADLEDELLEEGGLVRGVVLEVGLHRDVGDNGLSSELVRDLRGSRVVSAGPT